MPAFAKTILFKSGATKFRYESETRRLTCLNGKGETLGFSKRDRILVQLLNAAPEPVARDVFLDRKQTPPEGVLVPSGPALEVHINSIRRLLKDLTCNPDFEPKNTLKTVHSGGYHITPEGFDAQIIWENDEFSREEDAALNRAEAKGYENMSLLMEDLAALYPEDLSDFFYKSDTGAPLPFFLIDPEKFGRFSFPAPISEAPLAPPDRGAKSLVRRRKAAGREVYDGKNYRLIKADKDGWQLGRTSYFKLVDDCDYLKSYILAGWGLVCEDPKAVRKSFLLNDPTVKEWLTRVRQIKRGDFSSYHAGISFNTPIFRKVSNNNTLELLHARGSFEKQADGGKLHVCPAGMLEYSWGVAEETALTAEDFGTYALKEMIEETLRSDAFSLEEKIKYLDSQKSIGDMIAAGALRKHCLDLVEGLRHEIEVHNISIANSAGELVDLSLEAADESIKLPQDLATRPLYAIVDAFVLRPELIVPIFVEKPLDLLLNWENEKADRRSFRNLQDVEGLLSEADKWAAPGLAAAYLTAKEWFSRP